VTPTITTTYSVISGVGTCTASAVGTVSVSPITPITITPSNTTICSGQTVTLSSSGGTGPYTWTASSGTNPTSTGTVNVTPITTTIYTVISGIGICTVTAVASISVSPTLSVTITPSNTTICSGAGISLTANGATSYTWFPGLSTAPSLSVTPVTTTTYSLMGTDGVCTKSATATVTVISVSTSVTASSPIYCVGISPTTFTAGGATSYSWSPGTDLSSTTGSVVAATPTITSTYSVTGTTSGCISTQTILITVPPISTITATSSKSIICTGGSTTLTASGADTYTWAPGAIASASISVTPTTTSSYSVVGKTTDGCFAIPAVITVSVLPVIDTAITISSSTVCITNTVSITTSTVASGLTYTWQPTAAIQGVNTTSGIVAHATNSSNVIYTVTIGNGVCAATNTIQLKVLIPPKAINFITLNNDTVCVSGCVTFSSTTLGSQPMSYQWFYESGIGTSSVGIAPEACYPAAGSFSVTLITTNACGTDTLVKSNYITVYDMPVVTASNDTTIKIGESGQIFASGGFSYNWSPNVNGTIACTTCSSTIIQPTVTTQYIVVVSNSPYCKVQDTVIVNVDVNCGDFFIPNVFSPNGDGLNDVINVRGRCISTFNLQIFNRWGEKVFETSSLSESWDGTFRGLKLETGVFIYKADGVSIDGQSFKLKGNITLLR
jgi:gliding motility-associated-like protein